METFSALLALCAGNSPVPVNSPHKGQWRRALMFSLICSWINDWVNNREAGDLRHNRGHYDVNVMQWDVITRPNFKRILGEKSTSCSLKINIKMLPHAKVPHSTQFSLNHKNLPHINGPEQYSGNSLEFTAGLYLAIEIWKYTPTK